jgi:hypothetical protein
MNVDKMYITLRLRVGSASEGGSLKYIQLITVPLRPCAAASGGEESKSKQVV